MKSKKTKSKPCLRYFTSSVAFLWDCQCQCQCQCQCLLQACLSLDQFYLVVARA